MLKITDGRVTLFVTPGAYRDVYAPQGFTEVKTKTSHKDKIRSEIKPETQSGNLPRVTAEDVTEDNSEPSEDIPEPETPEPDEDLSEIPLSEMNSEQLRAYAKQLGVDLRGLNSKRAVRDRIKAAL